MFSRFIPFCLFAFLYAACKPDHKTTPTPQNIPAQNSLPVDVNVSIVGFTYITYETFGDSSVPAVVLDITLENKRADTFYCNIWTACYSHVTFEPEMPNFNYAVSGHRPVVIRLLKGEKLVTRTIVRYRLNPERTLRAGFYVMTKQECEDSHFPKRLTGKLVWSDKIPFPKFSHPSMFRYGEHSTIKVFRNDIIDTVDIEW